MITDHSRDIPAGSVPNVLRALADGPLGPWLCSQRWSGAKGKTLDHLAVVDAVILDAAGPVVLLCLFDAMWVRIEGTERYVVLLALEPDRGIAGQGSDSEIWRLPSGMSVTDATDFETVARSVFAIVAAEAGHEGIVRGRFSGRATPVLRELTPGAAPIELPTRRLKGEQSNTSYVLGNGLILKLLRKLQSGVHPEVEMTEFLTRSGFTAVPKLAGVLTYDHTTTVALLQEFVPNRGDAWTDTLATLRATLAGNVALADAVVPLERLGETTGAFHVALASDRTDSAFVPEPFGIADRQALVERIDSHLRAIERSFVRQVREWPQDITSTVDELLANSRAAALKATSLLPSSLTKIRVHGDYHLGQVLATDRGFVVIDFEGEPLLPLAERRAKSSPLRDVAGMLRSFGYAAHVALRGANGSDRAEVVTKWERAARTAFLSGYLRQVGQAEQSVVPSQPDVLGRVVALFELEKALYEIVYEIEHRPDWLAIPVDGARKALSALR